MYSLHMKKLKFYSIYKYFLELHFHHISILLNAITIFNSLGVNNMFTFTVKMEPNGELLLRILLEFDININNDITILHAFRLK